MTAQRQRVLQLLGPSTGGIRRHVAYLQAALGDHGWDVTVAGPEGVMAGVGRQDAVVPVPPGVNPWHLLRSRGAVRRLAAEVDVVHAHGLTPGWIAASTGPGPPVVVTVHNLVLNEVRGRYQGPVLRLLEARLPGRVDAVIAVSEGIARRLGAPPHLWVIPPAGPPPVPTQAPSELRARFGIHPGAPLIVSVARLNPQKDLPTLLRAVVAVRAALPGTRTLIVGEGRDRDALARLAAELGLLDPADAPAVVFAGPLPNGADALAAADVVAVTSRWESGPLVLFEAMLLGRPVVTTPVGLAPELVTDGLTGRMVPVGDVEALAAAITELLRDRGTAGALGDRGRAAAAAQVGPEPLVSAVADVYRATLAR
jgi:glycosyltransferase involved in cell wall biosynthesis